MIHGGDVYSEGLLKGRELLDFSSNINPLGLPESFKEHINEAMDNLVRYPDIKYRKVKEALSEYTGIEEEFIVIGNGAAEILDLSIGSISSAVLLVPSFAEYELSLKKWTIPYTYVEMIENHIEGKMYEYIIDYNKVLNELDNKEALIIANPNNPNGTIINEDSFKEILDFAEKNNKRIIIDEAFIEFVGDNTKSMTKYIHKYKCLFVVRALTKFFAMPGIRFGYGFSSDEKFLNKIREKQNPWNVNAFAEVAVQYSLKDRNYIDKSLKWIVSERSIFIIELLEIDIFKKVYKTEGNFVLLQLNGGITCEKLYHRLMIKGILIRKANNYIGLDNSYIRLAIKDREKNNIILKALKEVQNEMKG